MSHQRLRVLQTFLCIMVALPNKMAALMQDGAVSMFLLSYIFRFDSILQL